MATDANGFYTDDESQAAPAPAPAAPGLTPASVGLPDDPVASGSSVISDQDPGVGIVPASPTNPLTSFSFRGSTPHGEKFAGGVFGDADRRISDFEKQDAQRVADQQKQADQHYGQYERAVGGEVDATKQFAERDQTLQQRLVDFTQHAAEVEQRMQGEARAERERYLASYREQLSGVRQLAMQSGNPMDNMSRGQAFGLAGAQFAQGFLAARGIHIDVSGQVDRWVDRSIQEHQQKIANMRGAAEDQLHLYEIARQNSQDDWEARQRYRGFVIQGLQTSIQMNASRFQSDIAMARARQQVAKLQIEADATERQIGDAHFSRVHQDMATEFDRAYKQGLLSIEQYKAATDRMKAAAKTAAPANLNISDPEYLTDQQGKEVRDGQGNRVLVNRWRVDPNLPEGIKQKVYEKADNARGLYADYLDKANKMMADYKDAKEIYDNAPATIRAAGWDKVARLDDTGKVAKFLQSREQFVLAKVYNDSGKQINENEFNRQEELARIDKFFERGSKTEELFSELRSSGRKKFERNMENSGVKPIASNDAEYYDRSVPASPQTSAVDLAIQGGVREQPGYAGVELGKVAAKDSEETTKSVSGAWVDHQIHNGVTGREAIDKGQPGWAVAIDHLAAAVARPDYINRTSVARGVAADKNETPAEVRAQAKDALERLSNGDGGGKGKVPTDAIKYAQYMLKQIEADPQLSKAEGDADIENSPFMDRLRWRPTAPAKE